MVDVPGPGNYDDNHKAFGKDAKSFSMLGKKEQKYNQNPGPGSYKNNNRMIKSASNASKIGTS